VLNCKCGLMFFLQKCRKSLSECGFGRTLEITYL
jgi:hypothetical protein